jgi:hypothetical protein
MTTDRVRWSRLLAEGIVIVVSVLLALAADAVWSGVQSRQTAHQELRTVLAELEDRRRSLESGHRVHERALAGSLTLIEQLSGIDDNAPLQVSDTLASQLYWVVVSEPASPVLESFVQAGHIEHLTDARIGPALLRWKARVDDMASDEARVARQIDDRLVPYLVQEFGYVGPRAIPPGGSRPIAPLEALVGPTQGVMRLRSTRELRGLVAGQAGFLTMLTLQSSSAMLALDSLIALVEAETN